MKLNRTGSNWNRLERNKINENWDIIEGSYNDVVGQITDEVVGHLIDSAKLIWKEPVDTVEDLPTNAEVGETRMVREADPDGISYVYRYDGENWEKIQAIDVTLINEVDKRLNARLAETDEFRHYESMVSRKLPRVPMITIVDDDGWLGFYTVLYELAKEYSIPMTSAMITSRAMGFPGDSRPQRERNYNYDQVMEMQNSGLIEFVSHSHNHERLSEMSEEDIREDLNTTQNFMKKYGFNHRCFVIPFGDYGEREIAIVKEFFDYGTGGIKENAIVVPPVNNYLLGRKGADRPLAEIESDMDEAVDKNGWLILCTHVGQDSDSSREFYESIIQSALSKGLKFVKLEEGLQHHGNIAQFGGTPLKPNTTISSDGEPFGDKLGRVQYRNRDNGVNFNTPITSFPINTVTFTDINKPNASDFPLERAGVLYTHRYAESPYNRQVYITSRNYKVFVRYWDVEEGVWGSFFAVDISQNLGVNKINANTDPFRADLLGKITHTQIDGQAGFPADGLLVHYALERDIKYVYQELREYQNNVTWRRYWSGGWTEWTLDSYVHKFNMNSIDATTPINEYDLGITIGSVNSQGNKTGLPDNKSGILTTYKQSLDSPAFNYQEFVAYNSYDKYIRHAKTDGTWAAWKKFVLE